MALFTAAWGCRGAVHRGGPVTHLSACIARALNHPWLLSGSSSTASERRAARIRAPPLLPLAWGLYRCDGVFAESPLGGMVGAWGAAWWCLRPRHQRRWHQACVRTPPPITSRSSTVSENVSARLCGGPCARTWYLSWTPCSLSCSCWACGDATATIFGFSFKSVTT